METLPTTIILLILTLTSNGLHHGDPSKHDPLYMSSYPISDDINNHVIHHGDPNKFNAPNYTKKRLNHPKYSGEENEPSKDIDKRHTNQLNTKFIEELISRKLNESEEIFAKKLLQKMQPFNNTIEINYMEKMIHYLHEEMQANKRLITDRDNEINHMKRSLGDQKEEVRALRDQLDLARRAIDGLTHLVNNLFTEILGQATNSEEIKGKISITLPKEFNNSVEFDYHNVTHYPLDCDEVYQKKKVGISEGEFHYALIQPRESPRPFEVSCYVHNGESWTMLQRRADGSVDFYRNWADYKNGFGDLKNEFWLGNEKISQLTNQADYKLRVEMVTWEGRPHWAEYRIFRVGNENDLYRLQVGGYSGNAGNSLNSRWENDHNGQPFSTWDRDNDSRYYDNCAEHYRGAWWFRSCFQCHLNGVYYTQGVHNNFFVRNGVQWNTIHPHSSLKDVKMMIVINNKA